MKRRWAKRLREGQARERKKEGMPAYFGAHVKRTRFRKTASKEEKGNEPRARLATPPRGSQHKRLGKLRVSQDKSS